MTLLDILGRSITWIPSGSRFYKLVKALEYETANPGQDFDENETKIIDPERDIHCPIVSLMGAGKSTSSPAGQSRPISGDTLGGYRREEIPLEQAKSNTSGGQTPVSAMKRRGSSPLPAISAEAEKSTAAGDSQGYSNADDIVHGGEHYSNTANKFDPRVHGALSENETY